MIRHRPPVVPFLPSLLLAALLSGCAAPARPPALYGEPLAVNAGLRAGLQQYDKLSMQKAFAGAADGRYGYAFLGEDRATVMRTALANCQKLAARPCRVMDVSGEPYQDAYAAFGRRSQELVATLAVPGLKAYHFEAIDYHVPVLNRLRTGREGYHGPTPLTVPGAVTIATADVARRLKEGGVTLIDARTLTDPASLTLPNATSIDWAGFEDGQYKEPKLQANLERIMQLLQPDKAKPLIVFCESAECWVSANAVLRLRTAGYTNIAWYRGGIEAWKAAGLPALPAVPYATVWGN